MQRLLRAGFTMLELLIVIGLIGVLIGLLLPGMNAARESARRAACSNHLRQLAMAAVGYEAVHGRFPPGLVSPTDDYFDGRVSGFVYLLPHLEANDVYNRYARNESWLSKTNRGMAPLGPSVFLCPSNASGVKDHGGVRESPLDYALCKGDNGFIGDAKRLRKLPSGIFGINSRTRYRDIGDGASHTFAVGEASSTPTWKAKSTCG